MTTINNRLFYKSLKHAICQVIDMSHYRFEEYDRYLKLIPDDIITEDKELENFLNKHFSNYNLNLEDWREIEDYDIPGYFVCFNLSIKNKKDNINSVIEVLNDR